MDQIKYLTDNKLLTVHFLYQKYKLQRHALSLKIIVLPHIMCFLLKRTKQNFNFSELFIKK